MPGEPASAPALAQKLSHKSTSDERVDALIGLGLAINELATLIGVSEETIRLWRNKSSSPRRRHREVLDDVRAVALILLKGDVSPDGIVEWFHSRPPGHRNAPRPWEIITSDPQAVAAAAVAELEEEYDVMAEILFDAKRPEPLHDRDGESAAAEAASVEVSERVSGPARLKRIKAQQRALASSPESS